MITGIYIGLVIGILIGAWMLYAYKRILVMKANDGTAEYINGQFYYIKREGEENG
jgi:hypothetical protein